MKQSEKSNKIDTPYIIKPNWWFRFICQEEIMVRPVEAIFPQPYIFWSFKQSKSSANNLLVEEIEDKKNTGQPYYILNKFYQLNLPIEGKGIITEKTAYFYLQAGYIQLFLNDKKPAGYPISKSLLYPQEPNNQLPQSRNIEYNIIKNTEETILEKPIIKPTKTRKNKKNENL